MTSQRWQVLHSTTCLGHRWVAQLKEDGPGTVFDTWREAMDYADRMARTVEVELPKDATINLPTMRTKPSTDGVLVEWRNGGRWEGMRITRSELVPLTLALLAHARKEQQ